MIVAAASDLENSRASSELAGREKGIIASAGVHPEAAGRVGPDWERELEEIIRNKRPAAIGECGLDAHHPDPPVEKQEPILRVQVRLAKKYSLPLILHSRRAGWEVLRVLEQEGPLPAGGVFHCIEGDEVLALSAVKAGFCVGIGGPVTYPRNNVLRNLLKRVPRERILLETDCPYLPPQPVRGKRNEPAFMAYVAEAVARELDVSPEETAALTSANAHRLFGAR